ncbi:MAG: 5'-methylthioadenosine/adenosylhomocysteine nucleosidase [Epsilonproteobacteria bacterium]|nr:5'-methylthioadenosine/adenosylhomocysteine nucleosidase [Campylobacterota bacterium]NPA56687.1 5'-methylthioadenosine/adenosylhomocysteine nucleosidase [Campylobacterota bacterium]
MGAMPEEIEPILDFIGEYRSYEFAQNIYYQGEYKGIPLVVAYSKIGKVFASLTASVLIQHFKAEKLLFTGVAGALNPSLKIGDLIAARRLCQHDLDITAFGHPFGYVPEGKVFIEADRELLLLAHEVAREKGIDLKEGTVATGDQFIADPAKKEWIATTFGADAIEMEGAAVAVVCDAFSVPFFILRSISDAADMEASFDFDSFLRDSSRRSGEFMRAMLDRMA